MSGLCPQCQQGQLREVKQVAFCLPCDERNGIKRDPNAAVRTHLRCGRCELVTVSTGPLALAGMPS